MHVMLFCHIWRLTVQVSQPTTQWGCVELSSIEVSIIQWYQTKDQDYTERNLKQGTVERTLLLINQKLIVNKQ